MRRKYHVPKVIEKNHTKVIVRIEMSESKIRSTKSARPSSPRAEIRNNNKIHIFQLSKHVWNFGHLIFGFI